MSSVLPSTTRGASPAGSTPQSPPKRPLSALASAVLQPAVPDGVSPELRRQLGVAHKVMLCLTLISVLPAVVAITTIGDPDKVAVPLTSGLVGPVFHWALARRGHTTLSRLFLLAWLCVIPLRLSLFMGADVGAFNMFILGPPVVLVIFGRGRVQGFLIAVFFGLYVGLAEGARAPEPDIPEPTPFRIGSRTITFLALTVFLDLALNDRDQFKAKVDTVEGSLARAKEESQARMSFLTMMSHEIRTPLNAVIGLSDMLSAELQHTEHYEVAQTISSSSQALLTVVNDVLDFSRAEQSGTVSLTPNATTLDEVTDPVVQGLYSAAAAKGIQLCCDLRVPFPFSVTVDAVRLRQVLTNFVGNAIKFTERGHVLLRAERVGDDELELSVLDTGCGMREEDLSLIFEPYRQAEQGTRRRFDGTGLGLAICKRIVDAMGGRIGVESTEGEGSRFWARLRVGAGAGAGSDSCASEVRLSRVGMCVSQPVLRQPLERALATLGASVSPLSADEAQAPQVVLTEFSESAEETTALLARYGEGVRLVMLTTPFQSPGDPRIERLVLPVTRGRLQLLLQCRLEAVKRSGPCSRSNSVPVQISVLCAEDNAVNRKVLARMLTSLGCEATLVENGQLAVEEHRRSPAQLVLMDCHMPVMDGFAATRAIRQFDPDVPIVALTADAFDEARVKALDAGMNEVLTKPLLVSQLEELVRRYK